MPPEMTEHSSELSSVEASAIAKAGAALIATANHRRTSCFKAVPPEGTVLKGGEAAVGVLGAVSLRPRCRDSLDPICAQHGLTRRLRERPRDVRRSASPWRGGAGSGG